MRVERMKQGSGMQMKQKTVKILVKDAKIQSKNKIYLKPVKEIKFYNLI
jgi:hypothetical protein